MEEESKWNPIVLDSSFLKGDIEGLVGIEECTDYNLSYVVQESVSIITLSLYKINTMFTVLKSGNFEIYSTDFQIGMCYSL